MPTPEPSRPVRYVRMRSITRVETEPKQAHMITPFQTARRWLPTCATLVAAVFFLNCEGEALAPAILDSLSRETGGNKVVECSTPETGCPCEEEGAKHECGTIKETRGDYVICKQGYLTCIDEQWSECLPEGPEIIDE